MKPWERTEEINGTKAHVEKALSGVKKIHEVHKEVDEKKLTLSIELKLLTYMLIFTLLIKSIEIIKNTI